MRRVQSSGLGRKVSLGPIEQKCSSCELRDGRKRGMSPAAYICYLQSFSTWSANQYGLPCGTVTRPRDESKVSQPPWTLVGLVDTKRVDEPDWGERASCFSTTPQYPWGILSLRTICTTARPARTPTIIKITERKQRFSSEDTTLTSIPINGNDNKANSRPCTFSPSPWTPAKLSFLRLIRSQKRSGVICGN